MSGSDTLKGTVKWFNDAKGFGFIEHDTGADVFVHYSVIESDGFKTLKDGEEVVYELKQGPKGLHAVRVSRADGDEETAENSVMQAEMGMSPEGSSESAEDITSGNSEAVNETVIDISLTSLSNEDE